MVAADTSCRRSIGSTATLLSAIARQREPGFYLLDFEASILKRPQQARPRANPSDDVRAGFAREDDAGTEPGRDQTRFHGHDSLPLVYDPAEPADPRRQTVALEH